MDQNSAQYQVPALVLHEISHRLGTTEPEAQELQADYIQKNFRKIPREYRKLDGPLSDVERVWMALSLLSGDVSTGDFSCDRTDFYLDGIHRLKTSASLGVWSGELSWVSAWDFDNLVYSEVRANAVLELVCSWDKSLSPDKIRKHRDQYLSGFVGSGPYLAENYVSYGGITWKNLGLVQVPMRKCDSADCVFQEVSDLHAIMMQFTRSIGKIADSYFEVL